MNLSAVDAQIMTLRPKALFVVFQDWRIKTKDLVLCLNQQNEACDTHFDGQWGNTMRAKQRLSRGKYSA